MNTIWIVMEDTSVALTDVAIHASMQSEVLCLVWYLLQFSFGDIALRSLCDITA